MTGSASPLYKGFVLGQNVRGSAGLSGGPGSAGLVCRLLAALLRRLDGPAVVRRRRLCGFRRDIGVLGLRGLCGGGGINRVRGAVRQLGITAGLSFRPLDRLSVDFAFSYVTGFGRDGSYTDEYMLMKTIPNLDAAYKTRVFGGHYDAYALMPAIGISYSF